ncbi:uncharacterized protein OCT59_007968 [Rhizophagus irregularis]|uniref:uncharacterized protein n=1 Tax=Rhizophagus irregularis TaxID=588596 RepID=UPI0033166366|nr:hypothetical protein OCT59_007968 [Rhizophagus irregularis]
MASSVENSSQFESCVYNKLKSMKLCVSRTRGSYGDNGIDIFAPLKEHILLVQCITRTIVTIHTLGVFVTSIENGYTTLRNIRFF